MSKANAFSALFREANRHGVAESDKPEVAAGKRRSRGKRDDPDFGKIGVYIKQTTITEVKARLVRQDCDLSDLIQVLLDGWLKADEKPVS